MYFKKNMSLRDCQRVLLFNTAKFLTKELMAVQAGIRQLTEWREKDSLKNEKIDAIADRPTIERLEREERILSGLLNRQVYEPRDQNEYVGIGNWTTLRINWDMKGLFVDSTVAGRIPRRLPRKLAPPDDPARRRYSC